MPNEAPRAEVHGVEDRIKIFRQSWYINPETQNNTSTLGGGGLQACPVAILAKFGLEAPFLL